MEKYTNEQRLEIIKVFYRNSESVTETLRALTPIFGRNSRPSTQAITSLVQKLESTYSLCDVAVPVRKPVGRSVQNIAAVEASVANDPNQSILRHEPDSEKPAATMAHLKKPLKKPKATKRKHEPNADDAVPDKSVILSEETAKFPLKLHKLLTKSKRKSSKASAATQILKKRKVTSSDEEMQEHTLEQLRESPKSRI